MPYFNPDGTPMSPEQTFMLKLDLNKIHPYHGKPKDYDKFSTRYGYVKGRCNAYTRRMTCCKRYPLRGRRRCKRHGTGWYGTLENVFRKLRYKL